MNVHDVTAKLVKKAVIRDSSVPPGQPAPMFIECGCGAKLFVDFPSGPDVECKCGMAYNARGWVVAS